MPAPVFQLVRDTSQSIASQTDTAVTFTSAEIDNKTGWDAAHHSRYVVQANNGGLWLFIGEAAIDHGADPNLTARSLFFRVNGVNQYGRIAMTSNTVPAGAQALMTVSACIDVVPGDYIELIARQDSGGAATLQPTLRLFGGNAVDIHSPKFRLTRTTSQSLPSSLNTVIVYDTANDDNEGGWDAAHKSRYVVQPDQAGIYFMFAEADFDIGAHPTSDRRFLGFVVNGVNTIYGRQSFNSLVSPSGIHTQLATYTTLALAEGDYVEVVARQDAGVTGNLRPTIAFSGGGYVTG